MDNYNQILNDSELKDAGILENLLKNEQYKLDIALKYYQNEKLSLEEYAILIEFLDCIKSTRLNQVLEETYNDRSIYLIKNRKIERIISLFLRDKIFTDIPRDKYRVPLNIVINSYGTTSKERDVFVTVMSPPSDFPDFDSDENCYKITGNETFKKYEKILKDSVSYKGNYEKVLKTTDLANMTLASRYYDNEDLNLQEYSSLIVFFESIQSVKLNEVLDKLYDNNTIFSIPKEGKLKEIIYLYLVNKTYCGIVCGHDHVVALTKSGRIHCWGSNKLGQLDNIPQGDIFIDIASNGDFSLALDCNGKIHCWGHNNQEQLDNIPILPEGERFVDIACGCSHSVVLHESGKLYCWGNNVMGQIDNIPGCNENGENGENGENMEIIEIACGAFHSVALDSEGKLYCWGANTHRQLNGIPENREDRKFIKIACGDFHSVALDSEGRIYCWGYHSCVQLQKIPKGEGFKEIACGAYHSLALHESGKLYCWDGNFIELSNDIPQGDSFVAIACGSFHCAALDSLGKIHFWGKHFDRQLYNIPSDIKFTLIRCGRSKIFALDENGKVYHWDRNVSDETDELDDFDEIA